MADAINHLIAMLAQPRGGYVTRQQLLALGLSSGAISKRIRSGYLIPVYPGVYAVGHVPRLPVDRAHAALLACGPSAAMNLGSAASLWGFFKAWRFPFEVAITSGDRRPKGIRVRRCTTLAPQDVTVQLGLRTTTRARTVFDLSPRLTDRQLTRLVNDGRYDGHLKLDHVAEILRRLPRAPGAERLRRVTGIALRTPTKSELERSFLAFCERYGFPEPATNVVVGGVEVDVFFAEEELIVELDSHGVHTARSVFESDRRRDSKHLRAGIPTVRVTSDRMSLEPDDQADDLRVILANRRRAA